MAISDTVRRYVEAGREALSPAKAEDLARTLAKQGEIRRDQVSGLARDLVDWSRRNRERLLEIIRQEVKKQISRTGVATKDEVDSLKRRIRDLEREARKGAAAPRAGARTKSRTDGATRARVASTRSGEGTAKKTTRSTRPRKKTTTRRTTA